MIKSEFATKEYRHYVMAVNFRVKMPVDQLGEVDFVLLTPNKPVCVTCGKAQIERACSTLGKWDFRKRRSQMVRTYSFNPALTSTFCFNHAKCADDFLTLAKQTDLEKLASTRQQQQQQQQLLLQASHRSDLNFDHESNNKLSVTNVEDFLEDSVEESQCPHQQCPLESTSGSDNVFQEKDSLKHHYNCINNQTTYPWQAQWSPLEYNRNILQPGYCLYPNGFASYSTLLAPATAAVPVQPYPLQAFVPKKHAPFWSSATDDGHFLFVQPRKSAKSHNIISPASSDSTKNSVEMVSESTSCFVHPWDQCRCSASRPTVNEQRLQVQENKEPCHTCELLKLICKNRTTTSCDFCKHLQPVVESNSEPRPLIIGSPCKCRNPTCKHCHSIHNKKKSDSNNNNNNNSASPDLSCSDQSQCSNCASILNLGQQSSATFLDKRQYEQELLEQIKAREEAKKRQKEKDLEEDARLNLAIERVLEKERAEVEAEKQQRFTRIPILDKEWTKSVPALKQNPKQIAQQEAQSTTATEKMKTTSKRTTTTTAATTTTEHQGSDFLEWWEKQTPPERPPSTPSEPVPALRYIDDAVEQDTCENCPSRPCSPLDLMPDYNTSFDFGMQGKPKSKTPFWKRRAKNSAPADWSEDEKDDQKAEPSYNMQDWDNGTVDDDKLDNVFLSSRVEPFEMELYSKKNDNKAETNTGGSCKTETSNTCSSAKKEMPEIAMPNKEEEQKLKDNHHHQQQQQQQQQQQSESLWIHSPNQLPEMKDFSAQVDFPESDSD
ncbi:hypothetical protein T01_12681 [Trichinella spiralis]|uniref:Uncharacterized protein n=1 Tax=Trichinella spiralis TaxID=6334 RepID=A0A0V1BS36_TRISP|nr:hypothetical protein T01_12681 [Trichinella spiralis]